MSPLRKGFFFAAAAVVATIAAFPAYIIVTAAPLHPQPQNVPSAMHSEPSPPWAQAVDRARRVMRTALAEQNIPGLSVAVGAGGDVVWAEGFGWADIEARAPVTPNTRFRIGTASTVLTSAAVGALVENGRLNLDEEIQAYVPEFPQTPSPVTLRQLTARAATIDSPDDRPLSRQRCERPVEAVRHVTDGSQDGWVLVSAAVEAAADQPFLVFMREQVFQPLGMNDTGAETAKEENPQAIGEPAEDPPPFTLIRAIFFKPLGLGGTKIWSRTPRMSNHYLRGFGPDPVIGYGVRTSWPGNLSCHAGSMAFFSTPSDLVRFALAKPLPQTSYDGELPGGKVASLIREGGIVVAVTSNIAGADTSALARSVAEPFAAGR